MLLKDYSKQVENTSNVALLQMQARQIKEWLRDNAYAPIEAIREQRARLQEILIDIQNTVKQNG